MFKRSDDTVIGLVAGRCDWCGEIHVYGEKLDQLIAVSVDVSKNSVKLTGFQNNETARFEREQSRSLVS
jgi:hypothetical protein